MVTPVLLKLPSVAEYKKYFIQKYCKNSIVTFDNIHVYFKEYQFEHVFYESTKRNKVKDLFSRTRAERMDWIKYVLQSSKADLYQGWDKDTKAYITNRRVAVMYKDYVVVIEINKAFKKASFITAYVADNSIGKIKSSPTWTRQKNSR